MKIIEKSIIPLCIVGIILAITALYNELVSHNSDKANFCLIMSVVTYWIAHILAHKDDRG